MYNWTYDEIEIFNELTEVEYDFYKDEHKDILEANNITNLQEFRDWYENNEYYSLNEYFMRDEGNIFANAEINEGIVFGLKDKQALKNEMKDFYGDWSAFNREFPLITDFRELVRLYARKTRNEFKISLDYDEETKQFEMKSVIYNGSFMTLDNTTTLTEQEYNDLWDEAQAEMENE